MKCEDIDCDGKYFLHKRKNLPQPFQMQLSKKANVFSQLFAAYLKSTSNFEHFEKKDNPDSLCVFEIKDCKICG